MPRRKPPMFLKQGRDRKITISAVARLTRVHHDQAKLWFKTGLLRHVQPPLEGRSFTTYTFLRDFLIANKFDQIFLDELDAEFADLAEETEPEEIVA
jgi:hypothetical protein